MNSTLTLICYLALIPAVVALVMAVIAGLALKAP